MTAALVALFVWAFWHSFVDLWHTWQSSLDYSAGQLVPLAALYMIATRGRDLRALRLTVAPVGLVVFAVGVVGNVLGNYYLYASLANFSQILCANGLVLTLL